MADPKWFILKSKPVIYIEAFVEFYNLGNRGQVHEIQKMIKLEKMHVLTVENLRNLDAHQIIEISSVLRNIYMIPRDQN